MEREGEMGHLRYLKREDLRWQRRDVIIENNEIRGQFVQIQKG
jgi:hypothetical protein